MAKIKKKYRGVRYVAKVLKKYYPKRYKNQKEALGKAREVFENLQSQGKKVRVVDVLNLTRKKRVKVEIKKSTAPGKPPLLNYKFYLDTYYFDLQDYPTNIHNTTKEITFTSKLFNQGVEEVKGGSRPNYHKTFSGFVDFINKNLTSRDEAYEYLVKGTPPEWNEEKQQWESRIISIDSTGLETDFGYEPTPSKALTKEEVQEIDKKIKETLKSEPPPKEIPKSESLREKEIELELSKSEERKQIREMFLKGLLTKKEYKEELDLINKK
jgi:hypothetical protein